jgi:hypothetical protein
MKSGLQSMGVSIKIEPVKQVEVMDLRNQNERASRAPAASPAPQPNHEARGEEGRLDLGKTGRVLVVLLTILAILAIGGMVTKVLASAQNNTAVKNKQFQAVFLTNNQVYFGHLSQVDRDYVKLTNIYYLQVQQQVQPKPNEPAAQPQVSLAKLGSELHGPEDVMYISRQQVLFWENLKKDGKVADAINEYVKSKK